MSHSPSMADPRPTAQHLFAPARPELASGFALRSYFERLTSPLFIVAHPDDEVIGAGAQICRWAGARFVYGTDGAPRVMKDALASGFTRREDYAAGRRTELRSALDLAGLDAAPVECLGFVDQEASMDLVGLTRRVAEVMDQAQAQTVITQPYEGGHPDHDALSFAVSCARRLLCRQGLRVPVILEMTSYHNRSGIMQTGEFLPRADRPVLAIRLTARQRRAKEGLFECFASQQKVLQCFQLERECFRLAPDYDFTRPPHEGPLFYEKFDWGMTGATWRSLVGGALEVLGLSS